MRILSVISQTVCGLLFIFTTQDGSFCLSSRSLQVSGRDWTAWTSSSPSQAAAKPSEMFALKNGRRQLMVIPLNVGSPWCAPIKVKHGHVSCRTPRGEHHNNVMGTRCKIRCKQGYEAQSSEVVCMASKHWSSNYACRGLSTKHPHI